MHERRTFIVEHDEATSLDPSWWVVLEGRTVSRHASRQDAIGDAHARAKVVHATGQDSQVLIRERRDLRLDHRYGHDPQAFWTEPL